MSKTLERIQAFIRLANNNPNEHEANAAARKACKMLAENNVKFDIGQTINSIKVAWAKPYSNPTPPDFNWVKDMFDKARKEAEEYKNKSQRHYYDNRYYNEPWVQKPPKYNPADAKYYERKKERGFDIKGNKRKLKCQKCGEIKETLFMGLENIFECNDCMWTEWTKERKA